jgi:hypothetical protein
MRSVPANGGNRSPLPRTRLAAEGAPSWNRETSLQDRSSTRVGSTWTPRLVVALPRIVSPARVSIEHGFLLSLPHVASRDRSWRPVSNNRHHLHHLAVILVGPLLGPP